MDLFKVFCNRNAMLNLKQIKMLNLKHVPWFLPTNMVELTIVTSVSARLYKKKNDNMV